MKIAISLALFFAPLGLASCSNAATSPDELAKAFQHAVDEGDFAAAQALFDLDGAPAQVRFLYLDGLNDCYTDIKCTFTFTPADEALRKSAAAQAEQLHLEAPAVEGMIKVTLKPRDNKDSGSMSGTMSMPYAKIDGVYKVVTAHLSAAEIAARRAKTDDALLKELFAKGIPDATTMRKDWATEAKPLPPDGGDAGKALITQTRARWAAAVAKDPDAAVKAGGRMAALLFGDKDPAGKPVALEIRRRALHLQSLRWLHDVKVNGGYMLGDNAVLMIKAHDGIGWVVRGPLLMSRIGKAWEQQGFVSNTISYPAP
ncbi:MAG: hypothetical protein WBW61_13495 [Rhodanobacteraceae bacterium]